MGRWRRTTDNKPSKTTLFFLSLLEDGFFPTSYSIKRKKREKCCNFLLSQHMLRKKPGLTHCFTLSTALTDSQPSFRSPALCASRAEMTGLGTAGPPPISLVEDSEAQGGRKNLHCFNSSPAFLGALTPSQLFRTVNSPETFSPWSNKEEQPAVPPAS